MIRKISVLLIVIIGIIYLQGCYSLRKKFVRKKKTNREQELPVYLDFKTYPSRPSSDAYRDYFLFVKGWLDELMDTIKLEGSKKREKRAINEAIKNFEQMLYFFSEDKKKEFVPLYNDFLAIKTDIYNNPNLKEWDRIRLVRKIEKLKIDLERNMRYSVVRQWMTH